MGNVLKGASIFAAVALHLAVSIAAYFSLGIASHRAAVDFVPADVPGLEKSTSISIDSDGVLNVKASTIQQMAFGQGLGTAAMRMWQMEFQRRVGAGRLSEIVGDSGADIDVLFRTLGVYNAANKSYADLSTQGRSLIDAYTAGVNAFIAHPDRNTPLELLLLSYTKGASTTIEPWSPADSLVWSKIMSFDLSMNLPRELERWRLIRMMGITPERVLELMQCFDLERFHRS